jgi:hypothetical protein
MAICSRTGLTIPECSCHGCLEEQIRRFMPVLLEPEADSRTRGWHRAARQLKRWRIAA